MGDGTRTAVAIGDERVKTDDVLAERGQRYGEFQSHAEVTQALKRTMQASVAWPQCTPAQREALEMIVHKIGRIVNGDPNYADSWTDIAGYARLVEVDLLRNQGKS